MRTNRFLQIACLSGLMLMGVCTESFAAMNGEQVSDTIKVEKKRKAHPMPDVQPKYPSGMMECMKFLAKQIKYPTEAIVNKIQGKVYVRLLINEEGSVAEAKVTKSVHPLLDEEALRVAGLLQKFEPTMFQGKPVCAYFDFPVTFHLN